ncbi:MAG: phospholipid carrier-dependent glycosyltransferase [Rhodobacteraceae bacterium]|nr:MAG: phospholipid carrier-dependent glycosyltransferase [Paracoccaceae bacterium]
MAQATTSAARRSSGWLDGVRRAARAAGDRAVSPTLPVLGFFLLALVVYLPGQSALPVTDRDEARFAQASRQMLESGDFVDVRFQEAARHNKPALAYWAQAAAAAVAGGPDAGIAAFRAPSWLAAAGAVALTAWAGIALVGRKAALLGAAGLGACLLLAAEARLAKTDALLLFCCVAALGALARVQAGEAARRWRVALWLAVGLGLLVKGPIVLIPLAGALAGAALAARSWAPVRAARPAQGLAVALAVAAPWLIAITIASGGGFWAESVGRDLLAKAVAGQESHGAPPGYHTLFALATFWPWAVLLPVAAPLVWRRRREPAVALLLGWAAATFLVFELTPTKLPHYVLPAFPALALLLAAAAVEGLPDPGARWRKAMTAFWVLPPSALVLAAALGPWMVTGAPSPGALVLGLAAGAAGLVAAAALLRWRLTRFAAAAAVSAVSAAAAVLQFALPALTVAFPAPAMAAATEAWRCGDPRPPVLTAYREPSAVFHLGTDVILADGAGAAAAVAEGRAGLAWIGAREREAFLAVHPDAVPRHAIDAFNYSNGRRVALTLYDARGENACAD